MGARKAVKASDVAAIVARVRFLRRNKKSITDACEIVGYEYGREPDTIYAIMRRFEPTTDVAQAYLQSQALRLAMRVVRESNAPEAIDVLSRKNIGVLAPKTESAGGGGGFFLSVTAESCGAVKLAVATAQPVLEAAQECNDYSSSSAIECNDYTLGPSTTPHIGEVDGQEEGFGQRDHRAGLEREKRPHQSRIRPLGALSEEQQRAVTTAKGRLHAAKLKRQRDERRRRANEAAAQPVQDPDEDAGAAGESE